MSLSPKQKRFVAEYLIDLNATEAYKRAGYKDTPSAHANAARLIANDSIQQAIQEALATRASKSEVEQEDILKELGYLGFSDIGEILDFSGDTFRLRRPKDIPERARRAISSLKVKRSVIGSGDDAQEIEVLEFKLWDKASALHKLGQHLGMFAQKHEHEHKSTEALIVGIRIVESKRSEGNEPCAPLSRLVPEEAAKN